MKRIFAYSTRIKELCLTFLSFAYRFFKLVFSPFFRLLLIFRPIINKYQELNNKRRTRFSQLRERYKHVRVGWRLFVMGFLWVFLWFSVAVLLLCYIFVSPLRFVGRVVLWIYSKFCFFYFYVRCGGFRQYLRWCLTIIRGYWLLLRVEQCHYSWSIRSWVFLRGLRWKYRGNLIPMAFLDAFVIRRLQVIFFLRFVREHVRHVFALLRNLREVSSRNRRKHWVFTDVSFAFSSVRTMFSSAVFYRLQDSNVSEFIDHSFPVVWKRVGSIIRLMTRNNDSFFWTLRSHVDAALLQTLRENLPRYLQWEPKNTRDVPEVFRQLREYLVNNDAHKAHAAVEDVISDVYEVFCEQVKASLLTELSYDPLAVWRFNNGNFAHLEFTTETNYFNTFVLDRGIMEQICQETFSSLEQQSPNIWVALFNTFNDRSLKFFLFFENVWQKLHIFWSAQGFFVYVEYFFTMVYIRLEFLFVTGVFFHPVVDGWHFKPWHSPTLVGGPWIYTFALTFTAAVYYSVFVWLVYYENHKFFKKFYLDMRLVAIEYFGLDPESNSDFLVWVIVWFAMPFYYDRYKIPGRRTFFERLFYPYDNRFDRFLVRSLRQQHCGNWDLYVRTLEEELNPLMIIRNNWNNLGYYSRFRYNPLRPFSFRSIINHRADRKHPLLSQEDLHIMQRLQYILKRFGFRRNFSKRYEVNIDYIVTRLKTYRNNEYSRLYAGHSPMPANYYYTPEEAAAYQVWSTSHVVGASLDFRKAIEKEGLKVYFDDLNVGYRSPHDKTILLPESGNVLDSFVDKSLEIPLSLYPAHFAALRFRPGTAAYAKQQAIWQKQKASRKFIRARRIKARDNPHLPKDENKLVHIRQRTKLRRRYTLTTDGICCLLGQPSPRQMRKLFRYFFRDDARERNPTLNAYFQMLVMLRDQRHRLLSSSVSVADRHSQMIAHVQHQMALTKLGEALIGGLEDIRLRMVRGNLNLKIAFIGRRQAPKSLFPVLSSTENSTKESDLVPVVFKHRVYMYDRRTHQILGADPRKIGDNFLPDSSEVGQGNPWETILMSLRAPETTSSLDGTGFEFGAFFNSKSFLSKHSDDFRLLNGTSDKSPKIARMDLWRSKSRWRVNDPFHKAPVVALKVHRYLENRRKLAERQWQWTAARFSASWYRRQIADRFFFGAFVVKKKEGAIKKKSLSVKQKMLERIGMFFGKRFHAKRPSIYVSKKAYRFLRRRLHRREYRRLLVVNHLRLRLLRAIRHQKEWVLSDLTRGLKTTINPILLEKARYMTRDVYIYEGMDSVSIEPGDVLNYAGTQSGYDSLYDHFYQNVLGLSKQHANVSPSSFVDLVDSESTEVSAEYAKRTLASRLILSSESSDFLRLYRYYNSEPSWVNETLDAPAGARGDEYYRKPSIRNLGGALTQSFRPSEGEPETFDHIAWSSDYARYDALAYWWHYVSKDTPIEDVQAPRGVVIHAEQILAYPDHNVMTVNDFLSFVQGYIADILDTPVGANYGESSFWIVLERYQHMRIIRERFQDLSYRVIQYGISADLRGLILSYADLLDKLIVTFFNEVTAHGFMRKHHANVWTPAPPHEPLRAIMHREAESAYVKVPRIWQKPAFRNTKAKVQTPTYYRNLRRSVLSGLIHYRWGPLNDYKQLVAMRRSLSNYFVLRKHVFHWHALRNKPYTYAANDARHVAPPRSPLFHGKLPAMVSDMRIKHKVLAAYRRRAWESKLVKPIQYLLRNNSNILSRRFVDVSDAYTGTNSDVYGKSIYTVMKPDYPGSNRLRYGKYLTGVQKALKVHSLDKLMKVSHMRTLSAPYEHRLPRRTRNHASSQIAQFYHKLFHRLIVAHPGGPQTAMQLMEKSLLRSVDADFIIPYFGQFFSDRGLLSSNVRHYLGLRERYMLLYTTYLQNFASLDVSQYRYLPAEVRERVFQRFVQSFESALPKRVKPFLSEIQVGKKRILLPFEPPKMSQFLQQADVFAEFVYHSHIRLYRRLPYRFKNLAFGSLLVDYIYPFSHLLDASLFRLHKLLLNASISSNARLEEDFAGALVYTEVQIPEYPKYLVRAYQVQHFFARMQEFYTYAHKVQHEQLRKAHTALIINETNLFDWVTVTDEFFSLLEPQDELLFINYRDVLEFRKYLYARNNDYVNWRAANVEHLSYFRYDTARRKYYEDASAWESQQIAWLLHLSDKRSAMDPASRMRLETLGKMVKQLRVVWPWQARRVMPATRKRKPLKGASGVLTHQLIVNRDRRTKRSVNPIIGYTGYYDGISPTTLDAVCYFFDVPIKKHLIYRASLYDRSRRLHALSAKFRPVHRITKRRKRSLFKPLLETGFRDNKLLSQRRMSRHYEFSRFTLLNRDIAYKTLQGYLQYRFYRYKFRLNATVFSDEFKEYSNRYRRMSPLLVAPTLTRKQQIISGLRFENAYEQHYPVDLLEEQHSLLLRRNTAFRDFVERLTNKEALQCEHSYLTTKIVVHYYRRIPRFFIKLGKRSSKIPLEARSHLSLEEQMRLLRGDRYNLIKRFLEEAQASGEATFIELNVILQEIFRILFGGGRERVHGFVYNPRLWKGVKRDVPQRSYAFGRTHGRRPAALWTLRDRRVRNKSTTEGSERANRWISAFRALTEHKHTLVKSRVQKRQFYRKLGLTRFVDNFRKKKRRKYYALPREYHYRNLKKRRFLFAVKFYEPGDDLTKLERRMKGLGFSSVRAAQVRSIRRHFDKFLNRVKASPRSIHESELDVNVRKGKNYHGATDRFGKKTNRALLAAVAKKVRHKKRRMSLKLRRYRFRKAGVYKIQNAVGSYRQLGRHRAGQRLPFLRGYKHWLSFNKIPFFNTVIGRETRVPSWLYAHILLRIDRKTEGVLFFRARERLLMLKKGYNYKSPVALLHELRSFFKQQRAFYGFARKWRIGFGLSRGLYLRRLKRARNDEGRSLVTLRKGAISGRPVLYLVAEQQRYRQWVRGQARDAFRRKKRFTSKGMGIREWSGMDNVKFFRVRSTVPANPAFAFRFWLEGHPLQSNRGLRDSSVIGFHLLKSRFSRKRKKQLKFRSARRYLLELRSRNLSAVCDRLLSRYQVSYARWRLVQMMVRRVYKYNYWSVLDLQKLKEYMQAPRYNVVYDSLQARRGRAAINQDFVVDSNFSLADDLVLIPKDIIDPVEENFLFPTSTSSFYATVLPSQPNQTVLSAVSQWEVKLDDAVAFLGGLRGFTFSDMVKVGQKGKARPVQVDLAHVWSSQVALQHDALRVTKQLLQLNYAQRVGVILEAEMYYTNQWQQSYFQVQQKRNKFRQRMRETGRSLKNVRPYRLYNRAAPERWRWSYENFLRELKNVWGLTFNHELASGELQPQFVGELNSKKWIRLRTMGGVDDRLRQFYTLPFVYDATEFHRFNGSKKLYIRSDHGRGNTHAAITSTENQDIVRQYIGSRWNTGKIRRFWRRITKPSSQKVRDDFLLSGFYLGMEEQQFRALMDVKAGSQWTACFEALDLLGLHKLQSFGHTPIDWQKAYDPASNVVLKPLTRLGVPLASENHLNRITGFNRADFINLVASNHSRFAMFDNLSLLLNGFTQGAKTVGLDYAIMAYSLKFFGVSPSVFAESVVYTSYWACNWAQVLYSGSFTTSHWEYLDTLQALPNSHFNEITPELDPIAIGAYNEQYLWRSSTRVLLDMFDSSGVDSSGTNNKSLTLYDRACSIGPLAEVSYLTSGRSIVTPYGKSIDLFREIPHTWFSEVYGKALGRYLRDYLPLSDEVLQPQYNTGPVTVDDVYASLHVGWENVLWARSIRGPYMEGTLSPEDARHLAYLNRFVGFNIMERGLSPWVPATPVPVDIEASSLPDEWGSQVDEVIYEAEEMLDMSALSDEQGSQVDDDLDRALDLSIRDQLDTVDSNIAASGQEDDVEVLNLDALVAEGREAMLRRRVVVREREQLDAEEKAFARDLGVLDQEREQLDAENEAFARAFLNAEEVDVVRAVNEVDEVKEIDSVDEDRERRMRVLQESMPNLPREILLELTSETTLEDILAAEDAESLEIARLTALQKARKTSKTLFNSVVFYNDWITTLEEDRSELDSGVVKEEQKPFVGYLFSNKPLDADLKMMQRWRTAMHPQRNRVIGLDYRADADAYTTTLGTFNGGPPNMAGLLRATEFGELFSRSLTAQVADRYTPQDIANFMQAAESWLRRVPFRIDPTAADRSFMAAWVAQVGPVLRHYIFPPLLNGEGSFELVPRSSISQWLINALTRSHVLLWTQTALLEHFIDREPGGIHFPCSVGDIATHFNAMHDVVVRDTLLETPIRLRPWVRHWMWLTDFPAGPTGGGRWSADSVGNVMALMKTIKAWAVDTISFYDVLKRNKGRLFVTDLLVDQRRETLDMLYDQWGSFVPAANAWIQRQRHGFLEHNINVLLNLGVPLEYDRYTGYFSNGQRLRITSLELDPATTKVVGVVGDPVCYDLGLWDPRLSGSHWMSEGSDIPEFSAMDAQKYSYLILSKLLGYRHEQYDNDIPVEVGAAHTAATLLFHGYQQHMGSVLNTVAGVVRDEAACVGFTSSSVGSLQEILLTQNEAGKIFGVPIELPYGRIRNSEIPVFRPYMLENFRDVQQQITRMQPSLTGERPEEIRLFLLPNGAVFDIHDLFRKYDLARSRGFSVVHAVAFSTKSREAMLQDPRPEVPMITQFEALFGFYRNSFTETLALRDKRVINLDRLCGLQIKAIGLPTIPGPLYARPEFGPQEHRFRVIPDGMDPAQWQQVLRLVPGASQAVQSTMDAAFLTAYLKELRPRTIEVQRLFMKEIVSNQEAARAAAAAKASSGVPSASVADVRSTVTTTTTTVSRPAAAQHGVTLEIRNSNDNRGLTPMQQYAIERVLSRRRERLQRLQDATAASAEAGFLDADRDVVETKTTTTTTTTSSRARNVSGPKPNNTIPSPEEKSLRSTLPPTFGQVLVETVGYIAELYNAPLKLKRFDFWCKEKLHNFGVFLGVTKRTHMEKKLVRLERQYDFQYSSAGLAAQQGTWDIYPTFRKLFVRRDANFLPHAQWLHLFDVVPERDRKKLVHDDIPISQYRRYNCKPYMWYAILGKMALPFNGDYEQAFNRIANYSDFRPFLGVLGQWSFADPILRYHMHRRYCDTMRLDLYRPVDTPYREANPFGNLLMAKSFPYRFLKTFLVRENYLVQLFWPRKYGGLTLELPSVRDVKTGEVSVPLGTCSFMPSPRSRRLTVFNQTYRFPEYIASNWDGRLIVNDFMLPRSFIAQQTYLANNDAWKHEVTVFYKTVVHWLEDIPLRAKYRDRRDMPPRPTANAYYDEINNIWHVTSDDLLANSLSVPVDHFLIEDRRGVEYAPKAFHVYPRYQKVVVHTLVAKYRGGQYLGSSWEARLQTVPEYKVPIVPHGPDFYVDHYNQQLLDLDLDLQDSVVQARRYFIRKAAWIIIQSGLRRLNEMRIMAMSCSRDVVVAGRDVVVAGKNALIVGKNALPSGRDCAMVVLDLGSCVISTQARIPVPAIKDFDYMHRPYLRVNKKSVIYLQDQYNLFDESVHQEILGSQAWRYGSGVTLRIVECYRGWWRFIWKRDREVDPARCGGLVIAKRIVRDLQADGVKAYLKDRSYCSVDTYLERDRTRVRKQRVIEQANARYRARPRYRAVQPVTVRLVASIEVARPELRASVRQYMLENAHVQARRAAQPVVVREDAYVGSIYPGESPVPVVSVPASVIPVESPRVLREIDEYKEPSVIPVESPRVLRASSSVMSRWQSNVGIGVYVLPMAVRATLEAHPNQRLIPTLCPRLVITGALLTFGEAPPHIVHHIRSFALCRDLAYYDLITKAFLRGDFSFSSEHLVLPHFVPLMVANVFTASYAKVSDLRCPPVRLRRFWPYASNCLVAGPNDVNERIYRRVPQAPNPWEGVTRTYFPVAGIGIPWWDVWVASRRW